jgi:hypothetical protein
MCDINRNNKKAKKTTKKNYPKLPEKTLEECMSRYTLVKKNKSGKPSLKDTLAYKSLSPFGTYQNANGKYNYGNKSYLRKADLCKVLMNPSSYFEKNIKECKKDKKYHRKRPANKKNRVRPTRKGLCPPKRLPKDDNCPNDISLEHVYKRETTTGNDCCYKREGKKKNKKKPKKKKLTKLQQIIKDRAERRKKNKKKKKKTPSPDEEYSPDPHHLPEGDSYYDDYSPDFSM